MSKYFVLIFSLVVGGAGWAATSAYDYPVEDALAATIIGTPKDYQAKLENKIPREEKDIVIFPEREIPTYVPRPSYRYSLAIQEEKAPLVFVIAGTGGSHRGANMRLLEAALYGAGMHVVSLSSPTYANFIITASDTHIPGRSSDDAADLYRVMEAIWQENKEQIKVSDFYLTGYSLGGANAAFVSKLDEQRQAFNFRKVLMINPPVNLFNSVGILDNMLGKNIPGPVAPDFNSYLEGIMAKFTAAYQHGERLDFNDDFLYRVYENKNNEGDAPKPENLEVLIGTTFRLFSVNMITTADFAAQRGFILPKGHEFRVSETMTPYFKVAARTTFEDYFNEMYVPYFQEKEASLTREKLIQENSLESIKSYLSSADKVAVMHNEDDIILAPGEIDFFRQVFGDRAKIYPRGGHLGNMAHRDNMTYLVDYFKN